LDGLCDIFVLGGEFNAAVSAEQATGTCESQEREILFLPALIGAFCLRGIDWGWRKDIKRKKTREQYADDHRDYGSIPFHGGHFLKPNDKLSGAAKRRPLKRIVRNALLFSLIYHLF